MEDEGNALGELRACLCLPFPAVLRMATLPLPGEPAVIRILLIGHELRFKWAGF